MATCSLLGGAAVVDSDMVALAASVGVGTRFGDPCTAVVAGSILLDVEPRALWDTLWVAPPL